jgi:nucleotidyltransferase/DNA polymerase involved in DNA repair
MPHLLDRCRAERPSWQGRSDLQKPDGLVVITKDNLPDILLRLQLQEIYGIGERME